jgi:hypothetical protein
MRGLTSEEYTALKACAPGFPDKTLDDSEIPLYDGLATRGLLREETYIFQKVVTDPDGSVWDEEWERTNYHLTALGALMIRVYETTV